MTNIIHIEDLHPIEFINSIRSLNQYHITEKLDGANLIFGLDKNGDLYTTINAEKGKRHYNNVDWGNQLWSTGFRSAHYALLSQKETLKTILLPGDQIETEILFGKQPNMIPYTQNCIVLLKVLSGESNIDYITEITGKFQDATIEIEVPMIPYTNDGKDLEYKDEVHKWNIVSVPNVTLSRQDDIEIIRKLGELEDYLNSPTEYATQTKLNILDTPLNRRADWVDLSQWKFTKGDIKISRQKIRDEILDQQRQIKRRLLQLLIHNRSSFYGPTPEEGGWIEGLVITNPKTGRMFKLVDKETFLARKDDAWKQRDVLSQFRKDYLKKMKDSDVRKSLDIFSDMWLKDLDNYRQDYLTKPYENPEIHKRTLEKFYDEGDRIVALIPKITSGKNAFPDTVRIMRTQLPNTYRHLSTITPLTINEIQDNVLGSVGKSKTSGDIDIAIDSKIYNIDEFYNHLVKTIGEKNIFISQGLNIIHITCPIENKSKYGYVQVDFMFCKSIEWAKFNFFSAGDTSEYKGLYRTELLNCICNAMQKVRHIKGEHHPIERIGYVKVPAMGLQFQRRYRDIVDRGPNKGKYGVTWKVEHLDMPTITNPDEVASYLFGSGIKASDIESFEQVFRLVINTKDNDEQQLIFALYRRHLEKKGLSIPQEILCLKKKQSLAL